MRRACVVLLSIWQHIARGIAFLLQHATFVSYCTCVDIPDTWSALPHATRCLMHLEILTAARTRTLLRSGADLHAHEAGECATASPLDLSLLQPSRCESARLVILAAQPWSPATHELFPKEARALACALLPVLTQLGNEPRLAHGPPPSAFAHLVLAHLVTRQSRLPPPLRARLGRETRARRAEEQRAAARQNVVASYYANAARTRPRRRHM